MQWTVLLPRDYEKEPERRYPVAYIQGHFSTAAPGGFGKGGAFDTYWMADGTPPMISASSGITPRSIAP